MRDNTVMLESFMLQPAFRAMGPSAQSLYVWLKFEWSGRTNNNNGGIQMSVREIGRRMGVHRETAVRALEDLQRKGFVVITKGVELGVCGKAEASCLELTELPLPGERRGRRLYEQWQEGHDFPVVRSQTRNNRAST